MENSFPFECPSLKTKVEIIALARGAYGGVWDAHLKDGEVQTGLSQAAPL
jgi:hypothetical protein